MAHQGDPPKTKRQDRDAKLAEALRANLRRRKSGGARPTTPEPPAAPDEDAW